MKVRELIEALNDFASLEADVKVLDPEGNFGAGAMVDIRVHIESEEVVQILAKDSGDASEE